MPTTARSALSALTELLRHLDIAWVLIDAHAANRYRDSARFTQDIDLLLADTGESRERLRAALEHAGWRVRRFDSDGELLRLQLPELGPADLLVAGTDYQQVAIRRARPRLSVPISASGWRIGRWRPTGSVSRVTSPSNCASQRRLANGDESGGRWMMSVRIGTAAFLLSLSAAVGTCAAADPCTELVGMQLDAAKIHTATHVAAGPFVSPAAPRAGAAAAPPVALPEFCRVQATAEPAVQFEVWLPTDGWNGKFQGVGNGGTAGEISYAAMAAALLRGYATASTDTGHVNKGPFDSTWALGHPELVADFGHRALHVTTVHAKAIVHRYYARPAAHAYYVGCSKGGQQGLMEAQRYPEDYDGILAGDPANDWTRFYAGAHLWYSLATLKDPESYIPASKIGLLGDAVNAACDALDGIRDGVLDDPRKCGFDPAQLQCADGQDVATCMTAKQVQAIKDIWAGSRLANGELVYPGLVPGGEAGPAGWAAWTIGTAPFTSLHWYAAEGWFKNVVFGDPGWDFRTFSYDRDLPLALQRSGESVDAIDPNLRPLQARGAKLIVYHGWSDPDISPLATIAYYERVVDALASADSATAPRRTRAEALAHTQSFFRLFMVPGMAHCAGGPGPSSFDMLGALENWVERGIAPDKVIAARVVDGVTTRTRPLCVYPEVAKWSGQGSTDDAANFSCVAAAQ